VTLLLSMKNIPLLIISIWIFFIAPQQLTGEANLQYLNNLTDSINRYETTRGIDTGYYNLLEVLNKSLEEYRNRYGITHDYLLKKRYYASKLTIINYIKGVKSLKEVLDECDKRGYMAEWAWTNHTLANIYLKQGYSKKALEMFLKDANIFKKEKLWNTYAFSLVDIGNIYFKDKNYEKALYYYRLSSRVFRQHFSGKELKGKLVVCYQNMGLTYDEKQQPDSTLYYYHKAMFSVCSCSY